MRPRRLESRGWEVGRGRWEGDLKSQHGSRESLSFQAAWHRPDFLLHSSPEGDKPVLKTSPETKEGAQALAELLEPPQVGNGLTMASARPSLLG